MTLCTVVRNTRGLSQGDVVARLLPNGGTDDRAFRIQEVTPGRLSHHGRTHRVYLLNGVVSPFGQTAVKMIVTEGEPWCVSRGGH